MFPEDCIQNIVSPKTWWIKHEAPSLCRGALVFAFVPHVDQLPYQFQPVGRKDATQHTNAIVKVSPLKVDQPLKKVDLPVAAMSAHDGEVWAAYRAKKRPCLVVSCDHPSVDGKLTRGKPAHATAPTCLVAPYYGAKKTGGRAGYNPEFVERVRHAEYQQFFWDLLPFAGGEESILRLDHMQPIGSHYNGYKLSGFRLCDGGMKVMDEIIGWVLSGGVQPDSLIALYRAEIESAFEKPSNPSI